MKKYALIKALTEAKGPIYVFVGDEVLGALKVRVVKSHLLNKIRWMENGETNFQLSTYKIGHIFRSTPWPEQPTPVI